MLRARGADILTLATHFIDLFADKSGKSVSGLAEPAAEKLLAYAWPGNVRELQNVIENLVVLSDPEEEIPAERLSILDQPPEMSGGNGLGPALDLRMPGEGAEHLARHWLDAARYADTHGLHLDNERVMWPYRDWVIDAFNSNKAFDEFTIEQIAGDLLPDPSSDQLVATGFHRNTMLNEEGGIDPLEYRFYAMVDRVATTGTVWMGLTTSCAQCHSHKYDQIKQEEYYQLFS